MPYANKEDQREYQRRWFRQRRDAYLVGKCCAHCGSTEQLEIDHVDRSQKRMDNFWSYSEKKRAEELEKCQVLCRACHEQKTIAENRRTHCKKGHPLDGMVTYRGHTWARCLTCHRERERERKARKKEEISRSYGANRSTQA